MKQCTDYRNNTLRREERRQRELVRAAEATLEADANQELYANGLAAGSGSDNGRRAKVGGAC